MSRQESIDRLAGAYDPTTDSLVAARPFVFGGVSMKVSAPLPADVAPTKAAQLIRTRFVKIVPGGRSVVAEKVEPRPTVPVAPPEVNPLECCGKVFKSPAGLAAHRRANHKGGK